MNQKRSNEKAVVFITGGTNGIGACLVANYLALGYNVHTLGSTQQSIDKFKHQYKTILDKRLTISMIDLSQPTSGAVWIEEGITHWGKINILILNAGVSMQSLVKDTTPALTDTIMNINFIANVHIIHQAMPSLIKHKSQVAAISSVASMIGLPGRSAYGASKAALHRWLDSLRKELNQYKVSVSIISPGFVATNIRKKALNNQLTAANTDRKASKKIMSADTCAKRIMKAIEQKKPSYTMLNFEARIGLYLNRFFPRWGDKIIARQYIQNQKLIQ